MPVLGTWIWRGFHSHGVDSIPGAWITRSPFPFGPCVGQVARMRS